MTQELSTATSLGGQARLELTDTQGHRVVLIDKERFNIGRRADNDLRLTGADVSRGHAEIVRGNGRYVIRDLGSRYGTFVNGESITERELSHGDRIRLGRVGQVELTFLIGSSAAVDRATTSVVGDLRQVAALLEGLRALGSGRVLDEVLALVIDSAIEVTGAERGFIMLANPSGKLEFKLARARGRVTLPGTEFETSRRIPEQVFATGEAQLVADMFDSKLAYGHSGTIALGIRTVLCSPLRLVRLSEHVSVSPGEARRIGVLYLDSREKGSLVSRTTREALETLATEAAVAIENARLYREAMEKARMEEELRIAAEIQRALLPPRHRSGLGYEAAGADRKSVV